MSANGPLVVVNLVKDKIMHRRHNRLLSDDLLPCCSIVIWRRHMKDIKIAFRDRRIQQTVILSLARGKPPRENRRQDTVQVADTWPVAPPAIIPHKIMNALSHPRQGIG